MAGTLPSLVTCCDPCNDPAVVNIPGPEGDDGENGTNGTNGVSAFTTFTAQFTMPAELATAVATVATTAWMAVNEVIYAARVDGSVRGYFLVTAIGGATSVTLRNLEDTSTGEYADNSAPGSIFIVGSQLQPGGRQGPAGIGGATAIAGDVTGTLAASELTLNANLGELAVGDGTKAQPLTASVDGDIPVYDQAAPLGLIGKALLAQTGDADVATNRVVRLSAATGLPIPVLPSRMAVRDAGGAGTLVVDDRTAVGNARGTDAIDLQTSRNAVTQVASGNESVVSGGRRNTADGLRSVVVGGDTNAASATEAVVGGGTTNLASGVQSVVAGGDTNVASGTESTVGGGTSNLASGTQATIAGGDNNEANADEATVGGGRNNLASAANSTVAGGLSNGAANTAATVGGGASNGATAIYSTAAGGNSNVASGAYSSVGGGLQNTASATASCVPGGSQAVADKQGQIAHSAGAFAAAGDAQASDLIWRLTTLNGAPNKPLFLDGVAVLATIAASKTWAFYIQVIGRSAAGVCAAWEIRGAIQNNAGTVALVSAVTTTLIADGTGATWGVVGNVVVEADNVNDALNIRVGATVDPGVTVRWVATARLTEVSH